MNFASLCYRGNDQKRVIDDIIAHTFFQVFVGKLITQEPFNQMTLNFIYGVYMQKYTCC